MKLRVFTAFLLTCCCLSLALCSCTRGPARGQANSSEVDIDIDEAEPAEPSKETVATSDSGTKTAEPKSETGDDTTAKPATDLPPQKVTLGDPSLTAGIPGEGPLKVEEIKAWLADEKNHQPLEIELPFGLAAGAALVKGLDQNPMTRAKIELGRQLYFDKRLSADGSISCADCHHPDEGFARSTRFGVGVKGQEGNRNSPVSYNRILSAVQFWDGRAATLEEQAKGPIANPIEMANTHDVCVSTITELPGYKLQFEKIFPDGANIENIAKAIATFERAIVTGPSPADYFEPLRAFRETFGADLADIETFKTDDPESFAKYQEIVAASEAHPISEAAQRGREIFFTAKGGWTACHVGANFTDELYHNLGVGMEAAEPDLGRHAVTKDEKDKGAFKTPTLRNITKTGPYMHDGSQKTLEEVVEWYAKGGHANPHLSDKVKKLELTDQDKADLVEYMKALTGDFPKVETGRLPDKA